MPSARTLTDRHIAELAELYGWRHHHGTPSLTAAGYADGFPPHVLWREGRLVFITIAAPGLTGPAAAWASGLAEVRSVGIHVVARGDLRALTGLLRPDQPSAANAEPRAPPEPQTKDVRPSQRGGRRRQQPVKPLPRSKHAKDHQHRRPQNPGAAPAATRATPDP